MQKKKIEIFQSINASSEFIRKTVDKNRFKNAIIVCFIWFSKQSVRTVFWLLKKNSYKFVDVYRKMIWTVCNQQSKNKKTSTFCYETRDWRKNVKMFFQFQFHVYLGVTVFKNPRNV